MYFYIFFIIPQFKVFFEPTRTKNVNKNININNKYKQKRLGVACTGPRNRGRPWWEIEKQTEDTATILALRNKKSYKY